MRASEAWPASRQAITDGCEALAFARASALRFCLTFGHLREDPDDGAPVDPEDLGGLRLVASGPVHHAMKVPEAQLVQRGPVVVDARLGLGVDARVFLGVGGGAHGAGG